VLVLSLQSRAFFICLVWFFVSAGAMAQQSITFDQTEIAKIKTHGPWPTQAKADPGNQYSGKPWAQALGLALFHDSGLSQSGAIACATCHQAKKGFTDGLGVAQGAQQHVRNTQGLLDVAQQRWFGWDGGADSLWAASLRPMLSTVEMNNTVQGIAERFRDNWMSSLPSKYAAIAAKYNDQQLAVFVAKIIAVYTHTLQSPPTAFDRFRLALLASDEEGINNYPDSAKRGLKRFLGEANCHVCHFGPNFSNSEFHDTGRPFFTEVGQVDPGRYSGIKRLRSDPYNLLSDYAVNVNRRDKLKTSRVKLLQANWGQWRTPSLRNLSKTAPYMHDGTVATLRGVVDAYADIDPDRLHADGEAILKPLDMSAQDREDLVAFLKSLSEP